MGLLFAPIRIWVKLKKRKNLGKAGEIVSLVAGHLFSANEVNNRKARRRGCNRRPLPRRLRPRGRP